MELMIAFIGQLNSLSPLAVIGLLAIILFYQAKNNRTAIGHHDTLNSIKTNDLHELPMMMDLLNNINITLQRIEVSQGESFSFIRGRMNGGGHGNN